MNKYSTVRSLCSVLSVTLCSIMLQVGAMYAQYNPFSMIDKGAPRPSLDRRLADNVMMIASKRPFEGEVAQVDSSLKPFFHGVASGDPLADRVIIWTRVTPERDGDVLVRWSVATDPEFRNLVRSGSFTTNANRDYTVKVDVTGLEADRTYYYVFNALNTNSIMGRTKTLPSASANVQHVRLAIVSCSSLPHGFFNAYGRIADRNDLDAVLHLGDYIYEYNNAVTSYGGATGLQIGRVSQPANEIVTLADYRTRYSQYRLDPDLRRLHQQHPMIHVWDDHESANDSFVNGAENHQPATEGAWSVRKAVSKRVCYEWIPTRETSDTSIYRRFTLGNLVDIFMLDTRLEGREAQVQGVFPNSPQASRDSINNPNRTMLGTRQFQWLTNGMRESRAQWKVLGNQVMFAPVTIDSVNSALIRQFAPTLVPAVPLVLQTLQEAFYGDVWTNYPAERQKIVDFIRGNNINNVVIATGDFHTTFAFDATLNQRDTARYNPRTGQGSVAVEFMCPSISSANFDENFFQGVYGLVAQQLISTGVPARAADSLARVQATQATPLLVNVLAQSLVQQNRHIKNLDLTRHGYTLLDITPQRTQGDYWFVDTVLARSSREVFGGGFAAANNISALAPVATPAPQKMMQALPAPALPPRGQVVSVKTRETAPELQGCTILACYPNPAQALHYLHYTVDKPMPISVILTDALGKQVATLVDNQVQVGTMTMLVDLASLHLPSGAYRYVIHSSHGTVTRAFTIVR